MAIARRYFVSGYVFGLTNFLMNVSPIYDKMDYRTFILYQTRGDDHEQKGNGLRWDSKGRLYFRK